LALGLKRVLKSGFYTVVVLLLVPLMKLLFRMRVGGKEMIERGCGYIAVSRHRSYWDILVLATALGWRHPIHFIARRGLLRNPFFRPFVKAYATIIDRDSFGKGDFRRMLNAIKRERLVGIFPEGTTQRRVEAKAGAIRFARMTGKAFLPINIRSVGPYPPRYPFRFPKLTVSIGRPFSAADLERAAPKASTRAEQLRIQSQHLMEQVDAA